MSIRQTAAVAFAAMTLSASAAFADEASIRSVGDVVCRIDKIGKRAKEAGIETVTFDRGGYLYHGRVKELADGARAAGLDF